MRPSDANTSYRNLVELKYELYNGLFLTLPFPYLEEVGNQLPIFSKRCHAALEIGKNPKQIIDSFFNDIIRADNFQEKMKILFLFAQFVERQVVLFDAIEQAAFKETRGQEKGGSLTYLLQLFQENSFKKDLTEILSQYRTRIVLTAHPTQFYPEIILEIIDRFADAIKKGELVVIEEILLQLGMTSFRNFETPTPLSEAKNLLNRTSDIFYSVILNLESQLATGVKDLHLSHPVIELGFWPGGDRDGNPFVNVETTKAVAEELKSNVLEHYKREIAKLKKKLTFPGMVEALDKIEKKLDSYANPEDLVHDINELQRNNRDKYQGLFDNEIDRFRLAVTTFGFHFASLDLRQDSSAHEKVVTAILKQLRAENGWPEECSNYGSLSSKDKAQLLEKLCITTPPALNLTDLEKEPLVEDLLGSLKAVLPIQKTNGKKGLHRYIISNTQGAHNLLELCFIIHLLNLDDINLDLVPLFETVKDLKNASEVMRRLYQSPIYRKQLEKQKCCQTIMVGFSDGTKDGGYLTCNWEILKAKKRLEELGQENKIEVIFFDGRGGPPARGGGNTHKFYRALGANLSQKEVQLTIQGQTISSKFGSEEAAYFNLEQLFTSGLEAKLFDGEETPLNPEEITLLDELSAKSYQAYNDLRSDNNFLSFLEEVTPLRHFEKLNIASRPTKRGQSKEFLLSDLRAIPFVSAWSQVKLNIPGFYGLGSALKWAFENGRGEQVKLLYRDQLFFSTLVDNGQMALAKSNILFTKHLLDNEKYGAFIQKLHQEAELAKEFLLEVSGQSYLMENDPINRQSINLREKLMVPLLLIQQYAIGQVKNPKNDLEKKGYEKLLLKTIPAIVNASRNSA
jgi:phosphoenolpyruvate carboxylase